MFTKITTIINNKNYAKMETIKKLTFEEVGRVFLMIDKKNFTFVLVHQIWENNKWSSPYTQEFASYSKANKEFRTFAESLL